MDRRFSMVSVRSAARGESALKEVFEVFEPKKTPSAIKPLIESEKYLSGYA